MSDIVAHVSEPDHPTATYVEAFVKPTQTKNVTPDEDGFSVNPDPGYLLDKVNVAPVPWVKPAGAIEITDNGEGIDIAQYATAKVAVPKGVFPEGVLNIAADGDYNVTEYAGVHVSTAPDVGVIFSDYDNEGYPSKATVIGIDTIPADYLNVYATNIPKFLTKISDLSVSATTVMDRAFERWGALESVVFTNSVRLYNYALRYCSSLKRVEFQGDVSIYYGLMGEKSIEQIIVGGNVIKWENPFYTNSAQNDYSVMLYDFSHCTSVFMLSSVYHLPHATGCIIRVPKSLLTEWQNANIWRDLSDIIWEGNPNY